MHVGFSSIGISQLSLEYVGIPVNAKNLDGSSFNPTGDTVQMAFIPQPTQVPQVSDWQSCIWATMTGNILYPYAAYCLIGPGGTIQLGIGTYIIYIKFTDSPGIPVQIAGQLQVA